MEEKKWTRHIYPWDSLENIGDSFVVPEDKLKTGRQLVFAKNKKEKLSELRFKFDSSTGLITRVA